MIISDEEMTVYKNMAQNLPNYNEALTSNWQLVFNKFPGIIYFAQSVSIPSITMDGIRVPYKNERLYVPDNTIEYGQLMVSFIIDEDFENYDALLQEFFVQSKAPTGLNQLSELLHDISIIRYSSNKVPTAVFKFVDCSLTNIGSVNYNSTGSESDILICDATFNITQMYVQSFRKSNLLDGSLKCE